MAGDFGYSTAGREENAQRRQEMVERCSRLLGMAAQVVTDVSQRFGVEPTIEELERREETRVTIPRIILPPQHVQLQFDTEDEPSYSRRDAQLCLATKISLYYPASMGSDLKLVEDDLPRPHDVGFNFIPVVLPTSINRFGCRVLEEKMVNGSTRQLYEQKSNSLLLGMHHEHGFTKNIIPYPFIKKTLIETWDDFQALPVDALDSKRFVHFDDELDRAERTVTWLGQAIYDDELNPVR